MITARSTPNGVLCQKGVVSEVLDRISMVAEQYSEIKVNQSYIKAMNAEETFEKIVRTSRLVYNEVLQS